MLIFVRHMIEDMEFSNAVYTEDDACRLVNDLDDGKYHPDAWADFRDLEADEMLQPIYSNDECRTFCIGFRYDSEAEAKELECPACGNSINPGSCDNCDNFQ